MMEDPGKNVRVGKFFCTQINVVAVLFGTE